MRQLDSGNVWHPERRRDKIALRPEVFCHKRDSRHALGRCIQSVTHGAGGAAASMPVRCYERTTFGGDRLQQLVGGNR